MRLLARLVRVFDPEGEEPDEIDDLTPNYLGELAQILAQETAERDKRKGGSSRRFVPN